MAEGPRLRLSGQQRLLLNPGLNQSVALLRLDAAGLTAFLEGEAAANPWLQVTPPKPLPPRDWLARWQARGPAQPNDTPGAGPSLIAHVMTEVQALRLTADQAPIALALIEALEPSGWITEPLPRIAKALAEPLPAVELVLSRLQEIEPRGLFARGLAECLTLQVQEAGQMDPVMAGVLAHLSLLAQGQTARLARQLGVSIEAVQSRLQLLRGHNPKPGSLFDPLTPAHSREPDIILRADPKGGWQIDLNRAALPDLRLVPKPPETDSPEGAKARAHAILAMLKARNETLLRVAKAVLDIQGAAMLGGAAMLNPLTMAEVGETLDLHESTISRAAAGTSMDGPRGVIWLRHLFSPAVATAADGRAVSKAALKARLVQLISREDPQHRLRDEDLADALARVSGIRLSRRTIAAYREEASIPIAGRRGLPKSGIFAAKRPDRSPRGLSRARD